LVSTAGRQNCGSVSRIHSEVIDAYAHAFKRKDKHPENWSARLIIAAYVPINSVYLYTLSRRLSRRSAASRAQSPTNPAAFCRIPNVTIVGDQTKLTRTQKTNANGIYEFVNLPIGTYTPYLHA
jgi:hypothetical protein